ncbi:MAG: 50S ribosomal protein L2 [Nanoarchaeota archaeon]|nr:50S ribosomal protein L2 [Nanoarchaeota archaeon]
MPKRLPQQRRGKGGSVFRSPGHRFKGATAIRKYDHVEKNGVLNGVVKDIYHDPGKDSPMLLVHYENNEIMSYPAPLGIKVGDKVQSGAKAEPNLGTIMPLSSIPEGTIIYCIENKPGSGAKFVRTSGATARVIAHDPKGVIVQMPSRRNIIFKPDCRAVIGRIAGGGRKEKPFVKAVNKRRARQARGKKHSKVTASTRNAIDHPHGGGGARNKKNKSVSRRAPPGAKVGSISPKRTGRKRGKK